jgi:DNA-binding GntR family transcriptional regulator
MTPQTRRAASADTDDTGPVQLARKAEAELRSLIIRGELLPGEKIRQVELAAQVGVSRSPLREALRTLESEGLVTYETNRGYVVSRLRMEELAEIYRLRILVETEMMAHLRKPGPDVIARLKSWVDQIEDAINRGDFNGTTAAYREFHLEVFRLSGLTVFLRETQRLWKMTDSYNAAHIMPPTIARRIVRDHRQIIRALTGGDLDRARELVAGLPQVNEHVVIGLPAWE